MTTLFYSSVKIFIFIFFIVHPSYQKDALTQIEKQLKVIGDPKAKLQIADAITQTIEASNLPRGAKEALLEYAKEHTLETAIVLTKGIHIFQVSWNYLVDKNISGLEAADAIVDAIVTSTCWHIGGKIGKKAGAKLAKLVNPALETFGDFVGECGGNVFGEIICEWVYSGAKEYISNRFFGKSQEKSVLNAYDSLGALPNDCDHDIGIMYQGAYRINKNDPKKVGELIMAYNLIIASRAKNKLSFSCRTDIHMEL